jgi:hypothetical protein
VEIFSQNAHGKNLLYLVVLSLTHSFREAPKSGGALWSDPDAHATGWKENFSIIYGINRQVHQVKLKKVHHGGTVSTSSKVARLNNEHASGKNFL